MVLSGNPVGLLTLRADRASGEIPFPSDQAVPDLPHRDEEVLTHHCRRTTLEVHRLQRLHHRGDQHRARPEKPQTIRTAPPGDHRLRAVHLLGHLQLQPGPAPPTATTEPSDAAPPGAGRPPPPRLPPQHATSTRSSSTTSGCTTTGSCSSPAPPPTSTAGSGPSESPPPPTRRYWPHPTTPGGNHRRHPRSPEGHHHHLAHHQDPALPDPHTPRHRTRPAPAPPNHPGPRPAGTVTQADDRHHRPGRHLGHSPEQLRHRVQDLAQPAHHRPGRPPRQRIPTTPTITNTTHPADWSTTPTPQEGPWPRKGWAGHTH